MSLKHFTEEYSYIVIARTSWSLYAHDEVYASRADAMTAIRDNPETFAKLGNGLDSLFIARVVGKADMIVRPQFGFEPLALPAPTHGTYVLSDDPPPAPSDDEAPF